MHSFQQLLTLFDLSETRKLLLLHAAEITQRHVPPFQPEIPALIWGIDSQDDLDSLRQTLRATYPDDFSLRVAVGDDTVTDLSLGLLGAKEPLMEISAIYLPPLDAGTSLSGFQEVVARLRAPDGCPWDKKQTHQSLRAHLLEETYETLDAMDANDPDAMVEEFGDLLLQIVLNAQIASEADHFNLAQIIKGIHDKIIRRHPHVFGTRQVDGVGDVLRNWEQLKEQERKDKGESQKGILDGVPLSFPALNQAQEYQDRAARVGFDWHEIDGVLDKLMEEIEEIRQAETPEETASEIGDLLFVLVNFARWQNVDAESALREANLRFKRRFGFIEKSARQRGRSMREMSLDEMEGLWQEAKKAGL
jgi:tetrapyrrole methylase family protein/MazG family protein